MAAALSPRNLGDLEMPWPSLDLMTGGGVAMCALENPLGDFDEWLDFF